MCGISGFYFHNPNQAPIAKKAMEKLTTELLLGIEHRGHDATGFAAVTASGELAIEKADLEATRFNWWRSELPKNPQTVLLHTRFATQGTPMVLENNHPIHYEDVLVTHNGHISNDDEIFKDESLPRNAEVDSEAIAALVQKYGIDKVNIALSKLDGNYAVAVSDLRKPGTLVLAKGWSSPLYFYEATEGIIWASTEDTIINAARKALDLEINRREIDFLGFGRLLLIEDGKVEPLKFQTYEKSYYWGGKPSQKALNNDYSDYGEYASGWVSKGKNWSSQKEDEEKGISTTDPKHIEFWENERHPMAYTVKSGNHKFLFKTCDGCDKNYQTTLLTISATGYIFCPSCVEEMTWEKELLEAGENPAVVHEVVIDLIGEKYQTNPDFVNWLLFESDDDEINAVDTPDLVELYVLFNDLYDEYYAELTGKNLGSANHLAEVATEEDVEMDEEIEACGVEVFEDIEIKEPAKSGWLSLLGLH